MPLVDHFRGFRAQQERWIAEHIADFHECLSNDDHLLAELRGRESLVKGGAAFPTADTTSAEIKDAFASLDRGDFSLYRRSSGDATRHLIIVDQAEFLPSAVRSFMPLSTALKYDAAFSYAFANNAGKPDSINAKITNLATDFPDDSIEDLNAEKERILLEIRFALAKEILKLEHRRAYNNIVANPAIPPAYIPRHQRPRGDLSLLALVGTIVALHEKHAEIMMKIEQQISQYNEAKASLRAFLATSRCPNKVKSEGIDLLARLEAAEATQALSLLSLEGSRMIEDYRAQASAAIEDIKQRCSLAKQILKTALEIPTINDSDADSDADSDDDLDKLQGRRLLAAFIAEEGTNNPLDKLLELSASLKEEGIKLELRFREQTRASLQALVNNARIPSFIKRPAQNLLEMEREGIDPRWIRRETQNLQAAIDEINSALLDMKQRCEKAKQTLLATLRQTDIRPEVKVSGFTLLKAFNEAETREPWEKVLSLAEKLIEESETIKAKEQEQREWDLLRLQHGIVVERIKSIVKNARAPADFKTLATRLLEVPLFTLSLSDGKMQLSDLIQRCTAIERQLTEYQTKCDDAKTTLKAFLDTTPRCPTAVRCEGVDLLKRLQVADTTQANSSVTLELIEIIKVYRTKALAEIERIKQHCGLAKQILMTALEIPVISDSDKAQGRRLLAAFIAEESSANPLDTLLALNAGLKEESIKLEIQFREKTRASLQALVNDARIPSSFKKTARSRLDMAREERDPSRIRSETQNLQAAIEETTRAVQFFEQTCEEAKIALKLLLARTEIPDEILAKGRILLASYETATAGDMLFTLLPGLKEESKTIIKRYELYQKYVVAKTELQAQIDNVYIPRSLKSDAATLITRAYPADDLDSAAFHVSRLNHAITSIAREVQRIESECFANRRILEISLANLDIHPSLKSQGRALIDAYIAAISNGSTLDNLIQLAAGLKTENTIIKANHRQWQGYIGEKTALSALITDERIDASLKAEGRRALNYFNDLESNAATTLQQLALAALVLRRECPKINNSHAMRQHYDNAYKKIAVMRRYGQSLLRTDHTKGAAVVKLSDALKEKLYSFVLSFRNETPPDFVIFQREFKELLHSQDAAMDHHRHQWKPIVANILLALTGVGLIAIMIKAGIQAINPKGNADDPNRTFNHSLFFAKTRTQEQLESIEADIINRRLIV